MQKNFVKLIVLSQRNYLLQNVSLDTQSAVYTTPTKYSTTVQNISAQSARKFTTLKFYQKNISPQNVSLDMYHAVVTTAGNFVLKAEKIKKTCLFNVNNFFEMSCWTHRMQFWESGRKISPKVKNFLSSSAKKLRSKPSSLSTKLLSPKCFAGHLESDFDKPAEKIQVLKNFVQIQVLSQRNYFLQNVSLDT